MSFPSNKVSGVLNHGQMHLLEMPIFQLVIESCVANPAIIFIVLVLVHRMQTKKVKIAVQLRLTLLKGVVLGSTYLQMLYGSTVLGGII